MTTAKQGASGGGMVSKLVIVLLLAVTIGFYMKLVMVDGQRDYAEQVPQASVQVVEGEAANELATTTAVQDLPEDQMQLIRQVFAPELH